ncbi:MAG: alpha/beta hydrolase, partial [Actinomycetota bacterium]|nr:alpha/beta hydrolase [Actinomycetota bacterium]
AVLLFIGRSVSLLGPFVAALLVGSGAVRLLDLRRGTTSERMLDGLFGLAELVFGLAALLWPDATLLVVAILFGMRSVGFGVSLVWRGLAGRATLRAGDSRRRRLPAAARWVAGVLLVVAAAGTLVAGQVFRQGVPVVDAFYDAPATVPGSPGQLLRTEPYAGHLPDGMTAYRLLYTTTADDGVPALASAVLAVPTAATGSVPLVAWAHGTNGVARACAPSLGPDAIPLNNVAAMGSLTRNGWGVVATDYTGEGTQGAYPYLIGQGEARSVLDSIRAAHQVNGPRLSDQSVIWGHSQGGHAALWSGQIAPQYAPELQIKGVAAISPASDPLALAAGVAENPGALGATLGVSFVVTAYARTYPDIVLGDIVVPSARTFVSEAAARCTTDPGTLVTILTGAALALDPIVKVDPTQGAFGQRLRQNVPLGPWPAPLFIGQGAADEVVNPATQAAYVAGLCSAGRPLQFTSYPGASHMGVMKPESPLAGDLETWTQDRFAGRPATNTCR